MKYISQEWLDAVIEKSRTDETYLIKAKGLTEKQRSIATDCPGKIDILIIWEWQDGRVVKATRLEKPAPSDLRSMKNEPGFISTSIGTYDIVTRIARGELSAQTALLQQLIIFHGNLLAMLAKINKLGAFSGLCASIPCEY